MISLFIFKSNARGMRYGMGSYIKELTNALLTYTDIVLYIVNYHDQECKEYKREMITARYWKISIPSPKNSCLQNNQFEGRYTFSIFKLLSAVIPKNGHVIFQMNYIDDLPIIKILKDEYKYPVISIVHFAQWQQIFNGNQKRLNGLNINDPSNNIEFTLSKEKEMYQVADRIVSVTSYMKIFLIKEYTINPDKIIVVPNGLNLKKYQVISEKEKLDIKVKLGLGANEKIILFSGRIDQSKGVFNLLEAFEEVCKYADNLRLVLIGQGFIQDCFQKYHSYYGKITFTGFLPPEKVELFYHVADAGIVLSIYDHCPYSVIEMIAYRIPLILSRINGLNEMLNDSQCLFIEPVISKNGEISYKKEIVADAILSIIKDKGKTKRIIKDYKKLIRNKFSSKRMAEEMHFIYNNL